MASWSFDPTHSGIHFAVRHLMLSKVRGQLGKWSGTLDYDAEDPTRSRLEVHIEAGSLDTNEEKRDAHLRSPDFLDVEKYPQIVFKGTSISKQGEGYQLTGDLTIHGTTKPITLTVEALGSGKDPWGNEHAGFSFTISLSRKEYGIVWNQALETGGVLVGDKVEIEGDIRLVKAATKAA